MKYIVVLLLFGFGFAQSPDVNLMKESSGILEGALDAVTGTSINTTLYVPGYGLIISFDQLGAPDDIEGSMSQFGNLFGTLYNTVQGVPEDEWLTIHWSFGFSEKTMILSRLKPDNTEEFEVWVNGEKTN
jgi:hypothetical protein